MHTETYAFPNLVKGKEMRELDARVSGNTLVVLECENDFARVRLVEDKQEFVAVANDGKDALDLFKHPFAMIDRFIGKEVISL